VGEKLAVLGGPKAVPDGTIKPWPPITDVDRQMVMASIEGGMFVTDDEQIDRSALSG